VTGFRDGGPFNLPAGTWTDDTSLALCLIESLVECNGCDINDQMRRFVHWYQKGHLRATRDCFDIGTTTRHALYQHLNGSHRPSEGLQEGQEQKHETPPQEVPEHRHIQGFSKPAGTGG